MTYYVITLLVYFGVNTIAVWALDLQFGTTGILNFAFILFQAAGAYTAGVLTLGSSSQIGGFQTYILGASLPWPVPWFAAMLVGAALALVVGAVAMRPVRLDFQAISMLMITVVFTVVILGEPSFLNGSNGLATIPRPFTTLSNKLSEVGYGWFYVGLTAATVACVYPIIHRIKGSPWGRVLRSIRENPQGASALGTNVRRERLIVYMIGGAIAALSGAVLVQFITAWAPDSWSYTETFTYLTAVVVGGAGNSLGVVLGTMLFQTLFFEAAQSFPGFSGNETTTAAVQWMIIATLTIAALWWRPRGLLPERRRTFAPTAESRETRPIVWSRAGSAVEGRE